MLARLDDWQGAPAPPVIAQVGDATGPAIAGGLPWRPPLISRIPGIFAHVPAATSILGR